MAALIRPIGGSTSKSNNGVRRSRSEALRIGSVIAYHE
jgi:hypothetical protein